MVCSELSSEERRLLLLFITGTGRLPEAGCETLSIEVRRKKTPLLPATGGYLLDVPSPPRYPHNSGWEPLQGVLAFRPNRLKSGVSPSISQQR